MGLTDEQRKAMFAKKNGGSGVSKKDFDEELLNQTLKEGNWKPITPTIIGLDNKPLTKTFHSLNNVGGRNFLNRTQTGVPKLDKKMWYTFHGGYKKLTENNIMLSDDVVLDGIRNKKSDYIPPENSKGKYSWEKVRDGIYSNLDEDYGIWLIRGDKLTQEDLTKYYENGIDAITNEGTIKAGISPITDSTSYCRNCNRYKKLGNNTCKYCGYDTSQSDLK